MSDVYAQYFGSHSAAVLGVGGITKVGSAKLPRILLKFVTVVFCHGRVITIGDQTGNLWWRLQNGDIFTQHPPQISIVLIGTNDLGAASCSAGESGVDAAVSGIVSRCICTIMS